ncbi:MAG: hypothetical protein EOR97_05285 [Mesorhizobium sp.]|uniref:hypothetical protein n=1 Tax=Mesorhizobium sp. TaxID=1871066 RepID=UPI000FE45482|nr:hypothetical protein [Mesorhizobium sp.]RWN34170.1 MAG: hypothetical protein EOR97_05285 [Mesorhizobium sp.]
MGIWGWLLGSKREPRSPRAKFANLVAPVAGDEGFPATESQMKELRKLACGEPPPDLTLRQASLILSARDFSRVLLEDALKKRIGQDGYYDLQSHVVAYIVSHNDVSAAVSRWSRRNYEGDDWKPPRKDQHWRQVLDFIGPAIDRLGGR